MAELVKGKKYKIFLEENDLYIPFIKDGSVVTFIERCDGGTYSLVEYNGEEYRLDDGFTAEELPPPEAEAYTMTEIHEAAGFTLETKMFNVPHNGHLTKQTEVPRETPRQFEAKERLSITVTGEDADTVFLKVPSESVQIPTATIKDSVNPRQFESGAVRDSNIGKPRPDLISPYFLESLGNVLAKGAIKYGDRNWEKGMPQETFKESAARHYVAWMMNKEDEDHAAQLAFNIMAWIHFRDKDNAK